MHKNTPRTNEASPGGTSQGPALSASEPAAKPRILFVDDEINVLDGLRTVLRGQRGEWDMVFASSGQAALAAFDETPFDVVVTDMRMPKMDGAELLAEIKRRSAHTVRIVLSGQTDISVVMRTVFVAHQFLAKPCSAVELRSIIRRTLAHHALMHSETLQALVGQIEVLPPAPQTYLALTKAIATPDVSLNVIGKIIEGDPALSAKLLQLVNSAFFGLPRRVISATEAASLLGLSTIRSLALAIGALHEAQSPDPELNARLGALRVHSLLTAEVARAIASSAGVPGQEAFTLGVLHDIGDMVVSLTHLKRESLQQVPDAACIGSYLLGVWGLPHSITEAVAHHHRPQHVEHHKLELIDILYAANALVSQSHPNPFEQDDAVDQAYLATLGVTERQWVEWQRQAADVVKNAGALIAAGSG